MRLNAKLLSRDVLRRVLSAPSVLICLSTPLSHGQASPPACPSTDEGRQSAYIDGELTQGKNYTRELTPGMRFSLEAVPHGWQLRIRDARGLDLSAMTPPRMGPNPRDVLGWHFRDADNRGPNDGSVNAPQRLRLFEFEPGLRGTAGIKVEPNLPAQPGTGRGWLFIDGLGLDAFSDAGPNNQASAVWVRFSACLNWPHEDSKAPLVSSEFAAEEQELLYACGLPASWTPRAWLHPRWLGGDFDDDGALDYAAPIEDADGTRAIAVCLGGTWLSLLTPSDKLLEDATTVDQIEDWHAVETPRGTPDEIRLIRREKSEHAVWAEDRTLRARTLYRLVTMEP